MCHRRKKLKDQAPTRDSLTSISQRVWTWPFYCEPDRASLHYPGCSHARLGFLDFEEMPHLRLAPELPDLPSTFLTRIILRWERASWRVRRRETRAALGVGHPGFSVGLRALGFAQTGGRRTITCAGHRAADLHGHGTRKRLQPTDLRLLMGSYARRRY